MVQKPQASRKEDGHSPLVLPYKRVETDIEGSGQFCQGKQRNVELAALETRDVRAVHVRSVCQRFLRYPPGPSNLS